MENLIEKINNDTKEAMRAREALRLEVLRGVKSAFTNELVAKGRKPQEVLNDDEALAVIKRLAKQRKDSIEQFEAGGRADLAEKEAAELKILEEYLPAQMSEAEIEKVVRAKQAELGITDKSKMGVLIGASLKELGGQAEGDAVRQVVERVLS